MAKNIFSVDAETDGLYGDVWAIGAVVVDAEGVEIARFAGQVDSADLTDEYVVREIVPHVDLPRYGSRRELRDAFWAFWMAHRETSVCIADCGAPVEAGLFRACVADNPAERQWKGPYPLHEVATRLMDAGVDPGVDRVEFAGLSGLVKHNPVDDARASAACWLQAKMKLNAATVWCEKMRAFIIDPPADGMFAEKKLYALSAALGEFLLCRDGFVAHGILTLEDLAKNFRY